MAHRIKLTPGQSIGLFSVLAFGLVGWEMFAAVEAIQARDWIPVSGRVTEARMQSRPTSGSALRRRTRNKHLDFRYVYHREGKEYSSSKINFGGVSQFVNIIGIDFSGTLDRYSKGQAVTVYIDPDNPKRCVLERDFPLSAAIAFGVGVTLIIAVGGTYFIAK